MIFTYGWWLAVAGVNLWFMAAYRWCLPVISVYLWLVSICNWCLPGVGVYLGLCLLVIGVYLWLVFTCCWYLPVVCVYRDEICAYIYRKTYISPNIRKLDAPCTYMLYKIFPFYLLQEEKLVLQMFVYQEMPQLKLSLP